MSPEARSAEGRVNLHALIASASPPHAVGAGAFAAETHDVVAAACLDRAAVDRGSLDAARAAFGAHGAAAGRSRQEITAVTKQRTWLAAARAARE